MERKKIDYHKEDIYIYIESEIERKYRLNSNYHEPETIKWIESFDKEDIFFDIGANVGIFSLIASKRKVKTYSFEPHFVNFSKLCKNIILNCGEKNITPINVALSNKTKLEIFNIYSLIPGEAYNTLSNLKIKYIQSEPKNKLNVVCFALDDFIKKFKLDIPTHLKIDVDGEEFNILKGSKKILKSEMLKSINVEINESHKESVKIIKFLKKYGFNILRKYTDENADDIEDIGRIFNYIFVKND